MQRQSCLFLSFALIACNNRPPSDEDVTPGIKGEDCNPTYDKDEDPEGRPCEDGLVCDPVAGGEASVCGTPIEIHGQVVDAITKLALADALVNGLDRTGAPLGEIAVSDAMGHYVLNVSATRTPEGEISEEAQYTLQGSDMGWTHVPGWFRAGLFAYHEAWRVVRAVGLRARNPL